MLNLEKDSINVQPNVPASIPIRMRMTFMRDLGCDLGCLTAADELHRPQRRYHSAQLCD